MKEIHILYIVSTLKRSGPTNQLLSLIHYLDRSKFKVSVISLSPEPSESRWREFEELGVEFIPLNLSRFSGVFLAKNRVKRIIDEIMPDIIHSQGIRGDEIVSRLDVAIPKICTVHNYPQEDYYMRYGKYIGKLMVNSHINAFKKMNKCVGVSHAVEENLNKNFSVFNTLNIPNGVNTEIYNCVNEIDKTKLRNELKLPQDATLWISTGHLSRGKNPLFLIRQWQKLFHNDFSNILLFLGSGALLEECRNTAKNDDNILIRGRVHNVNEFLQASDYFLSASYSEGLPMAVVEALACGLPCLLSDIPPHREVYLMKKEVSNIFQINDDLSFEEGIKKIIAQDYEDLRKAALNLAQSKLSAETMSHSYQQLYLEMFNK